VDSDNDGDKATAASADSVLVRAGSAACTESVYLDRADVVRDTPTILRKKIEDVRGVGATLLRRLRVIEDLSATQFSQEQLLSIDAGVYTDRERAALWPGPKR
jgi:hypothetical protein